MLLFSYVVPRYPLVSDETLAWAREYKRVQDERARERNAKAGATALQ